MPKFDDSDLEVPDSAFAYGSPDMEIGEEQEPEATATTTTATATRPMPAAKGLFTHLPAQPLPAGAPAINALPSGFAGETADASQWRGGTAAGIDRAWSKYARRPDTKFTSVSTAYWDQQKQNAHEVHGAGGRLVGPDGSRVKTGDASGIGTQLNMGVGKHIFTLSDDDKLRTADAWGEHEETHHRGNQETHLGMVNHSSLVAGGDVKAAGELQVNDGKLEQLSDSSGHYKPSNEMTRQALDHVQGQGVDLHDTSVKLMRKSGNGPMTFHASAREFMATQDAMRNHDRQRAAKGKGPMHNLSRPGAVEEQMMDHRALMKRQLLGKLQARKARIAGGDVRVTGGEADAKTRAAATAWAGAAGADGVMSEHAGPAPAPTLRNQLVGKLEERRQRLGQGRMKVGDDNPIVTPEAWIFGRQESAVAAPSNPSQGSLRTVFGHLDEQITDLKAREAATAGEDSDSEDEDESESETSETSDTDTEGLDADDDWDAEADGDLDDIFEEDAADDAADETGDPSGAFDGYGSAAAAELYEDQY